MGLGLTDDPPPYNPILNYSFHIVGSEVFQVSSDIILPPHPGSSSWSFLRRGWEAWNWEYYTYKDKEWVLFHALHIGICISFLISLLSVIKAPRFLNSWALSKIEEPILILVDNLTPKYRERRRYLVFLHWYLISFSLPLWNWITKSKLSPTMSMSSASPKY